MQACCTLLSILQLPSPYTMKLQVAGTAFLSASSAFGAVIKRDDSQFKNGQPIHGKGKGAPILGMLYSCI